MNEEALARFLELVRREMDTAEVSVVPAGDVPPGPNVLVAALGPEHEIVVRLEEAPDDVEARQRRLDMLVSAFASAILGDQPHKPSPSRSLREELRALAVRAGAVDALVIDAHSPVVWGAVGKVEVEAPGATIVPLRPQDRERVERIQESHRDLIAALALEDDADEGSTSVPPPAPGSPAPLVKRAVDEVRAMPVTGALHRGAHLAHAVRRPDFGYIARSFAAIYVLIVVFDRAYDEIRAERAVRDGLPVIERLVLALPPFDPEPAPMAGVISLRGRRRRR